MKDDFLFSLKQEPSQKLIDFTHNLTIRTDETINSRIKKHPLAAAAIIFCLAACTTLATGAYLKLTQNHLVSHEDPDLSKWYALDDEKNFALENGNQQQVPPKDHRDGIDSKPKAAIAQTQKEENQSGNIIHKGVTSFQIPEGFFSMSQKERKQYTGKDIQLPQYIPEGFGWNEKFSSRFEEPERNYISLGLSLNNSDSGQQIMILVESDPWIKNRQKIYNFPDESWYEKVELSPQISGVMTRGYWGRINDGPIELKDDSISLDFYYEGSQYEISGSPELEEELLLIAKSVIR